jgi:hypothetical protein
MEQSSNSDNFETVPPLAKKLRSSSIGSGSDNDIVNNDNNVNDVDPFANPLIDPDMVSKEDLIALLRDVTATLKETRRQHSAATRAGPYRRR